MQISAFVRSAFPAPETKNENLVLLVTGNRSNVSFKIPCQGLAYGASWSYPHAFRGGWSPVRGAACSGTAPSSGISRSKNFQKPCR
jgi:hypothetical protein